MAKDVMISANTFFFKGRHVFSLNRTGDCLGTHDCSFGLCPRITTGLFLMDPFFFFAV